MQPLEQELERGGHDGRRLGRVRAGELAGRGLEGRHVGQHREVVGDGEVVAGVHDDALVEGADDAARVLERHPAAEHREHGRGGQLGDDLVLPALLERLDLDLPLRGRHERGEVAHPGDDHRLADAQRPAQRVRDQRLVVGDRESDRHPAALVDVRAAPGELADLGQHLLHERRDHDRQPALGAARPRSP